MGRFLLLLAVPFVAGGVVYLAVETPEEQIWKQYQGKAERNPIEGEEKRLWAQLQMENLASQQRFNQNLSGISLLATGAAPLVFLATNSRNPIYSNEPVIASSISSLALGLFYLIWETPAEGYLKKYAEEGNSRPSTGVSSRDEPQLSMSFAPSGMGFQLSW